MAKSIQIATLENTTRSFSIPVTELTTRVIQYIRQDYTAGSWNPDNNYNWVPGAFFDFTPKRADSVIQFSVRLPFGRAGGSSHVISNWYFWANNNIYYQWEDSMNHYENGNVWTFQVPSWGTSTGRIGLQHRSHANDNHEMRMYTTEYWDGGGSNQNCRGQMFIEEIAL